MISFYPGPSQVHTKIPKYVEDASNKGILSLNHRSKEFMNLCEETISLLKQKLEIPKSYTIFFSSSATECWEIIAQSLIQKKSTHVFNGAFGEKWFQYTQRLQPQSKGIYFNPAAELNTAKLKNLQTDLICLTQNETSNGTQVTNLAISHIKKNNPKALIAVDATSSMAGIYLNFRAADVWFASVQKCFGLPAGLAVMICSPRAINRIQILGEKNHYNSLTLMKEMIDRFQTTHTPNVLGIYLLMRVLKNSPSIYSTHQQIESSASNWKAFFKKNPKFRLIYEDASVQSHTVICITSQPNIISDVKKKARKAGFILGEGYGQLKKDTFRIANFPAIKKSGINGLKKFLNSYTYQK